MNSFLEGFLYKISQTEAFRKGDIILRLTGEEGGDFCLDCSKMTVRAAPSVPTRSPLFEVFGAAERIKAILEGKKEARKQFLAGGIRVRGDLRYLSDLALELGILDNPI